jgi:hypothetical protein
MFQFASNGGGAGNGWGSGIRFCNLASTSSTAVAVQFGVSASDTSGRSAQGAYLDNVRITGFGTQYDLESQAWNISVNHSEFLNPARYAIYANPSAVNSGENLSFVGITVADSLNKWIPNAVNLNLGSVIATFTSSNFDNAEVFCGAGTMNLISPYSENPGSVLRTTPWIDIGRGCVSTIVGMTAADDDTGVPATQVALSVEGSLSFYGGTIFGQHPATATFETRGAGHVFLGGDLDLPAAVPVLVEQLWTVLCLLDSRRTCDWQSSTATAQPCVHCEPLVQPGKHSERRAGMTCLSNRTDPTAICFRYACRALRLFFCPFRRRKRDISWACTERRTE